MSIRLLEGDCRQTLTGLEPDSVQCAITSPPYYGLRDYGTPPLVWGGDGWHDHEWQDATVRNSRLNDDTAGPKQRSNSGSFMGGDRRERPGSVCACGAWLGSLGLEPTVDLYIEHLVEISRAVRRVLRPDGLLWLNLGDSYAANRGYQVPDSKHKDVGNKKPSRVPTGYKRKDLLLIPFRVAMALQMDGWYLRSVIPWIKRNAMPESARDRPTNAVEHVFLLAKSEFYFWDIEAVRTASTGQKGLAANFARPTAKEQVIPGQARIQHRAEREATSDDGTRNVRTSDWFLESWQGLMLDDDGGPLALVVNPIGFKAAHYATFPPRLVEPMIRASTSEKGQCSECGAPWERVVEKGESDYARMKRENGSTWADFQATAETEGKGHRGPLRQNIGSTRDAQGKQFTYQAAPTTLIGWHPTCGHADVLPVSQTVLDPFAGSGTVGLVADRMNRNVVMCELAEGYGDIASARITRDAPMFVELERGTSPGPDDGTPW